MWARKEEYDSHLTPDEIKQLTPEEIGLLESVVIGSWLEQQMQALTCKQLPALTSTQLYCLEIKKLAPEQISAFTPKQIEDLNWFSQSSDDLDAHISYLTTAQIQALHPSIINHLFGIRRSSSFFTLQPTGGRTLSSLYEDMSLEQLAEVFPKDPLLRKEINRRFPGSAQMRAIPQRDLMVIAHLLTQKQVTWLTFEQITKMPNTYVGGSESPHIISLLSDGQISFLTHKQITNMMPEWLYYFYREEKAECFTKEQKGWMSAKQLAALKGTMTPWNRTRFEPWTMR